MVVGLLFALVATVLNSAAGLLESAGARRVTRGRPLATQPRYLAGLVVDGLGPAPSSRCATCPSSWCRPSSVEPSS